MLFLFPFLLPKMVRRKGNSWLFEEEILYYSEFNFTTEPTRAIEPINILFKVVTKEKKRELCGAKTRVLKIPMKEPLP